MQPEKASSAHFVAPLLIVISIRPAQLAKAELPMLFTLAGKGVAPELSARGVVLWSQPIQAPLGAACWTAVLLGALGFVSLLAGRGKRHKSA